MKKLTLFENVVIIGNYMKSCPKTGFCIQNEISIKMRTILIDWIIEVHILFLLQHKTFFSTITILDLYLSKKNVTKSNLQLVGMVATLVSSKIEEIFSPELNDFVFICNKTYTKDQIIMMKINLVETIDYSF